MELQLLAFINICKTHAPFKECFMWPNYTMWESWARFPHPSSKSVSVRCWVCLWGPVWVLEVEDSKAEIEIDVQEIWRESSGEGGRDKGAGGDSLKARWQGTGKTGRKSFPLQCSCENVLPKPMGDFDQMLPVRGVPCWAEKVWFARCLGASSLQEPWAQVWMCMDPMYNRGSCQASTFLQQILLKRSTKWHGCTPLSQRCLCAHTVLQLGFHSVCLGYSSTAAHRSVSFFWQFHSFPLQKCTVINFLDPLSQLVGLFSFFLNINNTTMNIL